MHVESQVRRRTHDERESSRNRLATSTSWSIGGHMEVTWQGASQVIGWSRFCRISSRHRHMAKRYYPHYARWCCGQGSGTEASRSSEISPQSKHRSQWIGERDALADNSGWVREVQVGRSCRSYLSRDSLLSGTRCCVQAHLCRQHDAHLYEISSVDEISQMWHALQIFPDSERRKEVVHYEQIPDQDMSKLRKNAADKKSNVVIKAKSIPVTPKAVASSQGVMRERWLVSIYKEIENFLQNMAIEDADPSLVVRWKSSGRWPLPCQMVFVLKPLPQSQQSRWWCPGRLQAQESIGDLRQLCLMARALHDYNQSRRTTLAIDAQSSMLSRVQHQHYKCLPQCRYPWWWYRIGYTTTNLGQNGHCQA